MHCTIVQLHLVLRQSSTEVVFATTDDVIEVPGCTAAANISQIRTSSGFNTVGLARNDRVRVDAQRAKYGRARLLSRLRWFAFFRLQLSRKTEA